HIQRYWDLTTQPKPVEMDDDIRQVKVRLRKLLIRSVERRMVSDVPVGAFLSGGIDSSAIVALMAELSSERVNTFTIGFREPDFDESAYAQIVARKFRTRQETIILRPESFLEKLI